MKTWILRFLLLFGVLCILFDVGEMIVRVIKPQLTFSEAVKFSDFYLSSDTMIPFSLLKNYSGSMLEYNGDYNAPIKTNSLGYRGEEITLQKPAGTRRILVLGDSMTFGIGVPNSQTYPSALSGILKEKFSSPIQVINAGYADGFSPDSYYLYLKNRGMALDPDVVVVGLFVWNDITDLTETVWKTVDSAGLPVSIESSCRLVDNGALRNKNIDFKFRYPWLRESNFYLLLINTLNERFHLFSSPPQLAAKRDYFQGCILDPNCIETFKSEEEKVYNLIGAMKKLTDKAGSKLMVLVLPVDFQLYPSDATYKYGNMQWHPPESDPEFLQKRIIARLSLMGIPSLDIYPVLDSKRDLGYPFFIHNAHFNALGNSIVAQSLASYLTEVIKL